MNTTTKSLGTALQAIRNRCDEIEALCLALDEEREVVPQRGDIGPPTVVMSHGGKQLLAGGEAEMVRSDIGPEARIYRTQANGVTRIVCVLAAGPSTQYLEQLKVYADGEALLEHSEPWVLDPGQAWVRSWYLCPELDYVDAALLYWQGRASHLTKPVPAWAGEKLVNEIESMLDDPFVGPYQPGLRFDPTGATGGADFGVSTNGHETWLCPGGFALHALEMERVAQRSRVFHMDRAGEPLWEQIQGGHWMSWEPQTYQPNGDAAWGWWPQYPSMEKYATFDDQHFPRAWRSASILMDVDPFASWYMSHCANRMALQWAQPNHDPWNPLLRGIDSVIRGSRPGGGTISLGRAGCWSALLSYLTGHALTPKFEGLIRRVSHPLTGELHADNLPSSLPWARHELGRTTPLTQTHEMAISVAVRRVIGVDVEGAEKTAALLRNTPGKVKAFGEDRWTGDPLPYVELQLGDFTDYGGSAASFLEICKSRSLLGSDQPLTACPREFWEHAVSETRL
jgi:hypothetical protein